MSDPVDELTATAAGMLQRHPTGPAGLVELEWSAVAEADDAFWRTSLAALFRAQGRTLATTPALGALVGAALLGDRFDAGFSTLAAAWAARSGSEIRLVLLGGGAARRVVVDLPDEDLLIVEGTDIVPAEGVPLDPHLVVHAAVPNERARALESGVRANTTLATSLAQIAISHEILGTCDQMMQLAIDYARDRKQFGQAIGSYQAVQHLLSAAACSVRGLEDSCDVVLSLLPAREGCARDAALLKALAGRTAREVAQATLQVLGAVGFTAEHEHHLYARRALTLDALYGQVDELCLVIARRARTDGFHRSRVF